MSQFPEWVEARIAERRIETGDVLNYERAAELDAALRVVRLYEPALDWIMRQHPTATQIRSWGFWKRVRYYVTR